MAVECDWTGKTSQSSKKNWAFLQKTDWFFEKNLDFLKIAKSSKFAVKCDWKRKISRNVQKLGFWQKAAFFQKIPRVFLKSLKVAKFL